MSTPARALMRRGDFWRLTAVGQISALPIGMLPLAYTALTAAVLGSYRVGGLLVTVGVLAQVVLAPFVGRLIDRLGTRAGMTVLLLVAAGGYGLLAALGDHAPTAVLVVLAVVPALPGSGLNAGVRTAMAQALPAELLTSAIAANATLLEGTLIVGPLIAAGLLTIAPTAAFAGLAVAMALAVLLLPRRRAIEPATTSVAPAPRVRLLRQASFMRWLACALGAGLMFGGIEVGALALAHRLHDGSASAALLLALLSGFSALAGLVYTAWAHRLRSDARRRAALLLTVIGGAALTVALAATWPVLAVAVSMLGLCAAPLMTTQFVAAQASLPDSQRAEGFALMFTAQGGGYALSSLLIATLPLTAALLVGAIAPLAAAFALLYPPRHAR